MRASLRLRYGVYASGQLATNTDLIPFTSLLIKLGPAPPFQDTLSIQLGLQCSHVRGRLALQIGPC